MASTNVDEKQQQVQHLEKKSSDDGSHHKEAVPEVDLENRAAVSGDDGDGKINWNAKTLAATICLAGLYVGE